MDKRSRWLLVADFRNFTNWKKKLRRTHGNPTANPLATATGINFFKYVIDLLTYTSKRFFCHYNLQVQFKRVQSIPFSFSFFQSSLWKYSSSVDDDPPEPPTPTPTPKAFKTLSSFPHISISSLISNITSAPLAICSCLIIGRVMLIPLIVKDLIYGFDRAPMAVIVSFLAGVDEGCEFKLMFILSKRGLRKKNKWTYQTNLSKINKKNRLFRTIQQRILLIRDWRDKIPWR